MSLIHIKDLDNKHRFHAQVRQMELFTSPIFSAAFGAIYDLDTA
jgi:hypothetical protein